MRRTVICFCAFLFFFLLVAHVLADDAGEELKCIQGQPSDTYDEDESAATKDRYDVPRKQVLLELFGRTT